jgi:hypothetical protein
LLEILRDAIGRLTTAEGIPVACAVELKHVAPALAGFAEAMKKCTGEGGWSFRIEDPGTFMASYTQLTSNNIITELAAANGSVFRFLVHKVEELCKDELYRDALLESASSRQVVLRLTKGANTNTNKRPIGVAFNHGILEVLQQAGLELGGGKAFVHEALRAALSASPCYGKGRKQLAGGMAAAVITRDS